MQYYLETERIGLKKLDEKELTQSYVDWLNDPEVTKYLVSGAYPSNICDLDGYIKQANSSKRVTFAVYMKESNHHIGNVKLDNIDWIARKADFGIMIGDKNSWGKGFATEITSLILEYAFLKLNLNRVYLGVVSENIGAIKAYEKIGFFIEGEKIEDQFSNGRYYNSLVMAITKHHWMKSRQKVVAIIQARVSSTRLPGKVLKEINGIPSILHVYNRTSTVERVNRVVIATSNHDSDNPLSKLCKDNNITCYRGDLEDVLKRYYDVALCEKADIVIRITGDCPLIDPAVVNKVLERYLDEMKNIDYATNCDPPTYPDGLDVEVFSFKALQIAHNEAKLKSEREHVTPYIRKKLKKMNIPSDEQDYSHLRWTVDEPEDFALVEKIYHHFGSQFFSMQDVLKLFSEKPELQKINDKFQRNEGYAKSILEEKAEG